MLATTLTIAKLVEKSAMLARLGSNAKTEE